MFQLEPKGRKSPCPSSKPIRQEEFPLVWARVSLFVLFRLLLRKSIIFTQSADLDVNLIQKSHPHGNTQNNVTKCVSGPPLVQSGGHAELTTAEGARARCGSWEGRGSRAVTVQFTTGRLILVMLYCNIFLPLYLVHLGISNALCDF